jgi:hypothetical protein
MRLGPATTRGVTEMGINNYETGGRGVRKWNENGLEERLGLM